MLIFRWMALTAIVLALASPPARAAIVLDVTTPGSTATGTAVVGGTFVVTQTHVQPAGSGVIDPFLRLSQPGSTDSERAFNTSVSAFLDIQPPVGDDKFTRALTLGEIPLVQIGGVNYREFLLDVNQTDNGPISLNQVVIFQSADDLGKSAFTVQEADATHDATIQFGSLAPVFQINNRQNTPGGLTTNTEIQADSGSGSGTADMFLYVPNALFANDPNSFITLFSQLGSPGAFPANAGFEEWAVREGVPPVPEPASLTMLGLGVVGLFGYNRRRRMSSTH